MTCLVDGSVDQVCEAKTPKDLAAAFLETRSPDSKAFRISRNLAPLTKCYGLGREDRNKLAACLLTINNCWVCGHGECSQSRENQADDRLEVRRLVFQYSPVVS